MGELLDEQDRIDDYEERAAIFQYCFVLERKVAEQLAWREIYGD